MTRAWPILLLLGLQASARGDDLSDLLDRMEKSGQEVRNLKATVTVWHKKDDRAKEEAPYTRGTMSFRSPGEFGWRLSDIREGGGHHPEDKTGARAILSESEFLLHTPWGSKEEVASTDDLGRDRHGAEWFRGVPTGESPPLLPMLADLPSYFPIALVFDLAPGRFLSKLPRLKLGATKKDGDRSYHVLQFRPEGDEFKRRQAEIDRSWNHTTFLYGEVWVDASDLKIARLTLRFTGHDRRYSVQRRAGGVATTILTEMERDDSRRAWGQRLELTDVSVNAGVDDEAFRLAAPAGRLVRDWTTRSDDHYQDRLKRDPKDAAAWLEIAALGMERGDWAPAEEAFRKVTDLRPDAPEGYLGLLTALHLNSDKGAGVEVLEKAAGLSWPCFHRAAAERYLARSDPASARRHFEAILTILGEDIPTLEEMARTVSRDSTEYQALHMRALRADLDRGLGGAAHTIRVHHLQPSEELVTLHREALKKDAGRPWIHLGLMELYAQLGKKEESRKSAQEVLKILEEGKEALGRHYTLQLLKAFTADKDFEGAHRLERAMASHSHPHARAWGLEIAGELAAIQKDLDGIVQHLDTALAPPAEDKLRQPNSALKPFLEALKREQKLEPLAAMLIVTPADTDLGRFHTNVLSSIAEQMGGSDRQKLLVRVDGRRNGRPADLTSLLNIVQSLAREKKWAEARTQAEALLARKDLTPDGRGIAESALAECHDAVGELALAVAACDRALAASPSRAPWIRMIRGRALLASKSADRVVENFAAGFEEGMKPLGETEKWSPEKMLADDLRKTLAIHKELLGEIETAAGRDRERVGFNVVLAVVEEIRGSPKGALEAFERAIAVRPSGMLQRELLLACLPAGRIDRAIEVRGKLAAAAFAKPPTGRVEEPFDIDQLNKKILDACEAGGDVDLCKRFARALAAEPLGRFGQDWTLRDLLLLVLDEEFFEEIDGALVRNAKDEWQRFHSHFPVAWAYGELGLGERGAAIYEKLLKEQAWSETYRSVGASWVEQLKGKTVASPVERLLTGLASRPDGDECEAVEVASRGQRGKPDALDWAWRYHVRRGKAEPIYLKLGAVRGRTSEERVECLEELARRGEPRPEWTLMLAITRVERGEEDRAAPLFARLLEATPEERRAGLWSMVETHLREPLGPAARAWARRMVAEARLGMADGVADRPSASMALAEVYVELDSPLEALLALAGAGEVQDPERLLQMRTALRARLPRDLFKALKEADLPKPKGRLAGEVERLVKSLESDEFDARMDARRGLIRIGAPAIPALLPLVDSPDADLQYHVRGILRILVGE